MTKTKQKKALAQHIFRPNSEKYFTEMSHKKIRVQSNRRLRYRVHRVAILMNTTFRKSVSAPEI